MDVPSFQEKYQRLHAEAKRVDSTGSLAAVYEVVLGDLAELKAPTIAERWITTQEAAEALGVQPKTIRCWCCSGKLEGAFKTGEQGGDWRIPASAVYKMAGTRGRGKTHN